MELTIPILNAEGDPGILFLMRCCQLAVKNDPLVVS
jgi:hypothetical protein